MGLTQREAAGKLDINPWTILNWEKGHTKPPIASIPVIVRFLGYDPFPEPETLPQHLLAKRRAMGWSIKEAAKAVGVDPATWRNWEHGGIILMRKHRKRIAHFLGMNEPNIHSNMAKRWNNLHQLS